MRRSGRRVRGAAGIAAAAVLLAGCGGSFRSAVDATTTATTTAPATTPAAPTTTPPSRTATPTRTSSTPRGTSASTRPTPTPGTVIAGEGLTADQAAALQAAVDAGHQPWRLDAASVAAVFVENRFGWTNPAVALADPHTAEVTDPAGGRMATLQLRQPVREGPGGIWVVDSGVWLK